MKRCPECSAVYENTLDVCPTCGEPLENYVATSNNNNGFHNRQSGRDIHQEAPPSRADSAYIFEEEQGRNIIINGSVAEANTQQYYQSRFTKIVQAIFSGEPYQLSHTSFMTIFRVEEHTTRGYPERARDITLYGNMHNVFAIGDDVTVTARRKGSRLVARNVYNHSINGNVRVQAYIPAFIIRLLAMVVALIVASIIYGIVTADYAAIGAAIVGFIVSLLPTIFVVWLIWYIIKGFFKK